jgi:hypothetical protein
MRPEEVLHLREDEYERPKRKGAWGWLHLTGATVTVGTGWGDAEGTTEHRALKHRGHDRAPGAETPGAERDPRRAGRPGTL